MFTNSNVTPEYEHSSGVLENGVRYWTFALTQFQQSQIPEGGMKGQQRAE